MDESIKKILNNAIFIAALAAVLARKVGLSLRARGVASDLADAAGAYRDIILGLNIMPSLEGFNGCEQGQLLLKWIKDGKPDIKLMEEWTAVIWSAIDNLTNGKLPK